MAAIPLEIVISATDKFTGTANRVASSLSNIEKSAGRVGKGVGQLAGGITRLTVIGGAAAVGGLAAIAKQTIAWESALAGVNKTMDLTAPELKGIGDQIRNLALRIPLSATAIAGLVEQAGALGIAKENVVQFAEAAATIGVTTNVSADEAATSLGIMSNLFKLTGDDYERFGSSLVDLGNKGASTEAQIIQLAERIAGAGSTVGLTADQVLGLASAIANVGIEPEAGGTSASRILLDMAKFAVEAGDELDVLAKTSGVSAKKFKESFDKDAVGTLDLFVSGLSKLSRDDRIKVLNDLGWDDRRVSDLLLRLAEAEKNNNNLTNSLEISSEAWKANTAAAEEADKRYGTVASKLNLLKNQAIEGALLVGEGFLPALGRLADKLKVVLTDPQGRQTLISFGQEIGKALDSIDVGKLLEDVRGLGRTFRDDVLPVIRTIVDLIGKLPAPIQAAGAGLAIAANTPLVGGALGQIGKGAVNVGVGALGLLGSLLPGKAGAVAGGAGKLFAQPVLVTNWPVGFGAGGGVGATGKGGGLGTVGALGVAGTIVALAVPLGIALQDALKQTPLAPFVPDKSQSQEAHERAMAATQGTKSAGLSNGMSHAAAAAMERQVAATNRAYNAVENARLTIANKKFKGSDVHVTIQNKQTVNVSVQDHKVRERSASSYGFMIGGK